MDGGTDTTIPRRGVPEGVWATRFGAYAETLQLACRATNPVDDAAPPNRFERGAFRNSVDDTSRPARLERRVLGESIDFGYLRVFRHRRTITPLALRHRP